MVAEAEARVMAGERLHWTLAARNWRHVPCLYIPRHSYELQMTAGDRDEMLCSVSSLEMLRESWKKMVDWWQVSITCIWSMGKAKLRSLYLLRSLYHALFAARRGRGRGGRDS